MVLQRWQSVLLLIVVIVMGCFSFMSLGQIQTPDATFNFTALGMSEEGILGGPEFHSVSTWYLFAVSILSAILALIAIFSFKKPRLQKQLCLIIIICLICVVIAAAILGYNTFDGGTISWSSLICAPFISMIATAMAWQRIKSDVRKINDWERLR